MLTFPLNPSDPFSHPLILSQAASHSLPHPHSHSHSHLSKTAGAVASPPMLTSPAPLLTSPASLLLTYLTLPASLHSPPRWSFPPASFTLPQPVDAVAPPSPR